MMTTVVFELDNDVTASRLIGMKGIWKRGSYYDRDADQGWGD